MAARDLLQAEGIGTRVVSMPCWELFEEQDEAYRRRVLPGGPGARGVEAAIRFGWDRWLYGERGKREKSGFVGMHGFGASAPAESSTRISASPPRPYRAADPQHRQRAHDGQDLQEPGMPRRSRAPSRGPAAVGPLVASAARYRPPSRSARRSRRPAP
jgi:hypothetical protein